MQDDLSRATRPLPSNLVRVPQVKQRTDYSCGAAATLALLRFWRASAYERMHEWELYQALETTPAGGTEPEPIARYLSERAGLKATYLHGDVTLAQLERALDAGEPPLVDLQAWRDTDLPWAEVWDAGHYAILVGYDDAHLFFMDPSVLTPGAYAYIDRCELAERWHDIAGPEDRRLERMVVLVSGDGRRPGGETTEAAPEGEAATRMY